MPFSIPPHPTSISVCLSPDLFFFAASLRTTCGVGSSLAAEQTSNAPCSSRERGTPEHATRKRRAAATAATTTTTMMTSAACGGGRLLDVHERVLEFETHKLSLSRFLLRGTSLALSPRRVVAHSLFFFSHPFSLALSPSHATCIRASLSSLHSLAYTYMHVLSFFLAYYRDCPTHFSVTHRAR